MWKSPVICSGLRMYQRSCAPSARSGFLIFNIRRRVLHQVALIEESVFSPKPL